ncbi:MAG: hypothetical protein PHI12_06330 [Dehalococcoidales bacterium]|nr:hypothetical protein [Dehalococcoidales bacterium]
MEKENKANAESVAAGNFARMVAGGATAHGNHARSVTELFLAVARDEVPGYGIKDEQKLLQLALELGVEIGERSSEAIAIDVGEAVMKAFDGQAGEALFLRRAPLRRQELWRKQWVAPRGIDREVAATMHSTDMGADQDFKSLLKQTVRTALSDGWGGSMIATELKDVIFGTPAPFLGRICPGTLKKDAVNLLINGHDPELAVMLTAVIKEPDIIEYARSRGAKGINLAGMGGIADEVLMRHGIPPAGSVLQQELAVLSGLLDAVVVDARCIMHGLADVARCYHTRVITTDPRARVAGAPHIEFSGHNAAESAREIVRIAIDNFTNRDAGIPVPRREVDLIAGFSHETINYLLGGLFRASYRPLNENIINGRIRGVAGVVGGDGVRVTPDGAHVVLVKELIKNDVLVLQTGFSAIACAEAGLMVPEAAAEYAGKGLASVCEAVGIPPVLHLGSDVDNTRILVAATMMVKDGGLGDDISELPVAGADLEWVSEPAASIGQYFVGSGVFTVLGIDGSALGSRGMTDFLSNDFEKLYGGMWAFEPDPIGASRLMIEHIDRKRRALGIDKARERILYDMDMRRELDAA